MWREFIAGAIWAAGFWVALAAVVAIADALLM